MLRSSERRHDIIRRKRCQGSGDRTRGQHRRFHGNGQDAVVVYIDTDEEWSAGFDAGEYLGEFYVQGDGKYTGTVEGAVNGDEITLNLDESAIKDGALTGETSGRVTNDVGEYTWNTTVEGLGQRHQGAALPAKQCAVVDQALDVVKVCHGGEPP